MLLRNAPTQIILFSATFPDHVRTFASKFAPSANKIELKRNELAVDSIRQFYMDCKSEEHKYEVLVSLYHLLTIGQSIIFCQQRRTADRIAQRMTVEGHKVASLHGAKEGSERDLIIDGFREGREKVLITTNVISRGIDVLQVNMVVNYDLPMMNDREGASSGEMHPDIETYIHRIGMCLYWKTHTAIDSRRLSVQDERDVSVARVCRSTSYTIRIHGTKWRRSKRRRANTSHALTPQTLMSWRR